MTKPDAGVGGVPHIERQIAALPAEIEKLKEEVQKNIGPGREGAGGVQPAPDGGIPRRAGKIDYPALKREASRSLSASFTGSSVQAKGV